MLGTHPIEIALGSTYDRDQLKTILAAMSNAGLAAFFLKTDSKEPAPADVLAPATMKKMAAAGDNLGAGMATTNKTVLHRWLKRWRDTHPDDVHPNIGVNPGLSRVIVVDVDTTAEQDAFLAYWAEAEGWAEDHEAYWPEAGPTPTVLTPGDRNAAGEWVHRDGGHYWFTLPDGWEIPEAAPGVIKMPAGWAIYLKDCYVLVPPSVRPEGPYLMAGRVHAAPEWLLTAVTDRVRKPKGLEAGQAGVKGDTRPDRAMNADAHTSETSTVHQHDTTRQADTPELPSETSVDDWAASTSWEDLLIPAGYQPYRPDKCGADCMIYTAPGVHASPKSATAHGAVCDLYDPSMGHGPLHFWTDNAPGDFEGKGTYTKLQFFAINGCLGDIAVALDTLGIGYTEFDLKTLQFEEFEEQDGIDARPIIGSFDWDMPAPEPLIDGLIFRQSHVMLIGEPSAGKSFTALDMACCIAMGVPYHGRPVYQGHVVYVAGEGYRGVVQRVRAWADKHGFTLAQLDEFLHRVRDPESIPGEKAAQTTRLWWQQFGTELRALSPELTIIDTMARVSVGLKENDASDMARVVEACGAIIDATDGTVMLLHHTARSTQHARGSTALLGSVDTELFVKPDADIPGGFDLVTTKQKDAEQAAPIPMVIVRHGTSAVVEEMSLKAIQKPGNDAQAQAQEDVMAFVSGSQRPRLRITDISLGLSTKWNTGTVAVAIGALLEAGKLEHPEGARGRKLIKSVQLCDTGATPEAQESDTDDEDRTA